MDSIKMIADFSNAYGAPGFEDDVVNVGRKYANHLAHISEDSIRNLFLRRNGNSGEKPVIMLDAHSDEVGFMVQAIKPNGTIQFVSLGGWVENTVPAHKVKIRNTEGVYISGIVASKPPHFMSEAERNQTASIAGMVIDVGACSKEEIMNDFKITIGAPIVPDVEFEYNEKSDILCGKAFDCRLGCASVIGTLEHIKDFDLQVDVVGTLSTQEEMGMRGAQVAANTVKPDIAIVFEGTPADDTFAEPYMIQTALKKGPMLRHIDMRMITNPRFIKFALDIGKKHHIDVQEAVRTGGGTNGAPIHLSHNSVPVIVIGIPVRYIHTHYGYATLSDYKKGIELASQIIKELDESVIKMF